MSGTPIGDALDAAHRLMEKHADALTDKLAVNSPATRTSIWMSVEATVTRKWPHIVKAVEALASAKVLCGGFALVGDQPVPRVKIRVGKKTMTFEPRSVFENMVWRAESEAAAQRGVDGVPPLVPGSMAAGFLNELLDAIEPALAPILAPLRADVANAMASAMRNDELTRKIKGKLAKKRALRAAKARERVKYLLKELSGDLSKDDVVQAWDEVMCAQVMES